ncbi:MAG TPA: hypothetical protein VH573_00365 [Mycobacteriales bacterium]|jgi:hypothetical protein
MFVQVIHGRTGKPEEVHAAMERWVTELAPGADGWVGSTGGVTDDGRLIALARFESADAARRNSQRAEQDRWWRETASLLDGDAGFADSEDVTLDLVGNPDEAGFVQIMRGHGTDTARARELMTQDSEKWAAFRPEILGTVAVGHPDGGYTVAIYFTSEADARAGERKEPPPELAAQMEEMNKLMTEQPEFFDLKQPWLYSR